MTPPNRRRHARIPIEPPARRSRRLLEAVVQDLRFAVRTLRRSPGYTCAAVGVLALGIGANTAIFSVLQGVLFAPLPFRQGERLVLVRHAAPGSQVTDAAVSIPEPAAYRQRARGVRDLVEYHGMSFTLLQRGEPDRVDTGVVSANFFDMLGIRPLLGRAFADGDDAHGAEAVLMLSHGYWQQKFGGDPRVIGTVVVMNDRPHTIVGVLPDFPQYPRANDVYMPTSACPFRDQAEQTLAGGFRSFAGLSVFGRLAPEVSAAHASAEIAGIASTFPRRHAEDYQRLRQFGGRVEPLQENLVREARPLLLALTATAVLVRLIAAPTSPSLHGAHRPPRPRAGCALRVGADVRLLGQLMTEACRALPSACWGRRRRDRKRFWSPSSAASCRARADRARRTGCSPPLAHRVTRLLFGPAGAARAPPYAVLRAASPAAMRRARGSRRAGWPGRHSSCC